MALGRIDDRIGHLVDQLEQLRVQSARSDHNADTDHGYQQRIFNRGGTTFIFPEFSTCPKHLTPHQKLDFRPLLSQTTKII